MTPSRVPSPSGGQRFRGAFRGAVVGLAIVDADGRLADVNRALCAMAGLDEDDLIGREVRELVHPDDVGELAAAFAELLAGDRTTYGAEARCLRSDGRELWTALSLSHVEPTRDEDGFVVAHMVDITARRTAESDARRSRRDLEAREAEFRMLAENTSDFLSRHSPDGIYRYASPACFALSGHAPDELVGTALRDWAHEDDRQALLEGQARAIEARGPAIAVYRVRCKNGELRWFESTLTAVGDADGLVVEMVAVTRDVTERKQAEQELSHAALHDALTGLPNRTLFLDRLGLALLRGQRRTGGLAVLFLDLDRFKVINDSLGHHAGDRLLVDVAERVAHALRPADTVARFGGDEFTVLLDDIDGEQEAAHIAQRLVDVFTEPFVLDGGELFLQTSIGIAIASTGRETAEELIRDADAAMYRAKERGKGRFELFDEQMRADVVARLNTESSLRRALDRGELRVHYQPEFDIASRRVVGFEALVRWQHPTRGLLAPSEFIPLAEETGLIVPIGDWVLREACSEVAAWRDRRTEPHDLMLAVNLSVRQFTQPDLVASIGQVLTETRTDPRSICLEITESAMMQSGAGSAGVLAGLEELGVRLAIDDFGTGYSSLAHLRRFPIDVLKIDRTFVDGLGRSPQDASMAAAIITLAHALGLETVAEGIENADQLALLRQLGCDTGQGFLFAGPCTLDEAIELVDAQRAAG